ncbi:MAG TPA: type I phosphomannose isomerase catalytic subunit, partial [Acidobacteriaceae bacterium]
MSDSTLQPFRLQPWFSPRPWGRRSLEPWYSAAQLGTTEPIGEAWLTGPQCIVETGPIAGQTLASAARSHTAQLLGAENSAALASPEHPEFPLLVKLLFPAEKLSVQVHPDDAHAQAMGQPRGKTECWYVLSAEPGAQIALGFKPALGFNPALTPGQIAPDAIRAAIAAGTLEDLLNWVPVFPGDMVFVDAGTVHAIGPGMVLLETQQTSDTTFRMYDYGRPRELHIDQALRVMRTSTAAGKVAPQKIWGA